MNEQRTTEQIAVVDSDNYRASGVETMFFPGGEPHVKIPQFDGDVLAHLKIRTWNDTGFATLLLDAIERQRVGALYAFIPYFPGARQDRTDGLAPLTLDVMSRLLDIQRCRVIVFDPHSPKLRQHVDTWAVLMPTELVIPQRQNVVGIIAPDEGAQARAFMYRNRFYPGAKMLVSRKKRNPQTGALSHYEVPPLPAAGHYIIVDDICDGGGTFNLLAQALARDQLIKTCSFELFVSHGIFSKGLDAIDPLITHITTTDSWCRLSPCARLTVLPLLPTVLEKISA